MNKTSLLNRGGTKLGAGLAALVLFSAGMYGCATAAQSTSDNKDNSSSSSSQSTQLVGPDYYQSSDNPYHAD